MSLILKKKNSHLNLVSCKIQSRTSGQVFYPSTKKSEKMLTMSR